MHQYKQHGLSVLETAEFLLILIKKYESLREKAQLDVIPGLRKGPVLKSLKRRISELFSSLPESAQQYVIDRQSGNSEAANRWYIDHLVNNSTEMNKLCVLLRKSDPFWRTVANDCHKFIDSVMSEKHFLWREAKASGNRFGMDWLCTWEVPEWGFLVLKIANLRYEQANSSRPLERAEQSREIFPGLTAASHELHRFIDSAMSNATK